MKIFFLILTAIFLYAQNAIQPIPKHIPYNKHLANLGKILFFDPNLSSDRSVSCASCHKMEHGGADTTPKSIGVGGQMGDLNSPTVFNAVFNTSQFWNGRAKDLTDQVWGPLHNPKEMNMSDDLLLSRLNGSSFYKKRFQKVFGSLPITYKMVAQAIAEFEKVLITPDCKFDRYLRKEVKLEPKERQGYLLFKRLGCITCHNGINMGGNSFQKIGSVIPFDRPTIHDRFEVTKKRSDKGLYKVPTLRNIALTSPYFHDGSIPTLQEAITKMSYHNLGFSLTKKEQILILKFLQTLTGKIPSILENDENLP